MGTRLTFVERFLLILGASDVTDFAMQNASLDELAKPNQACYELMKRLDAPTH
ncbi:hypothetical protein ACIPY2_05970 [Paenarthrobacter sp. NPDC089675]|uniref:hypothetical protein n=1 Tax=Paenarthrobacter sp. NPDC089675 TaxID=3364376 RepID=UPI0037FB94A5